jgi:hypothetical protein
VVYPLTQTHTVIAESLRYASQAPDELTTMVMTLTAPPVSFLPTELHRQPFLRAVEQGPV